MGLFKKKIVTQAIVNAANNSLFLIYRKYDKSGQSNKPEWEISCANKNLPLLEKYRAEKYLEQ